MDGFQLHLPDQSTPWSFNGKIHRAALALVTRSVPLQRLQILAAPWAVCSCKKKIQALLRLCWICVLRSGAHTAGLPHSRISTGMLRYRGFAGRERMPEFPALFTGTISF